MTDNIQTISFSLLNKGNMGHYILPKNLRKTRGPVGLYRSPGVQNFINKVLGFSHKRSSSMMENI